MNFVKKTAETVATVELPTPIVLDVSYNEETKKMTVILEFDMDYPDQAIINRYGKAPADDNGNPTGESKPVTSKTYAKGKELSLGFADLENNDVFLNVSVQAKTKEAIAAEQAAKIVDTEV
jgi:hypothetical protein